MGSKTALSPTTPEFGHLEYALQLSLKSSTARITQAFVVSNPNLSAQFDRKCKDILVLNSWIDPSCLSGANTEDEVIRRGFQFQNAASAGGGMKVVVGNIPQQITNQANISSTENMKIMKKLLFCKLGVGRAFVCSDESALEAGLELPDGYESFYIDRDTKASEYHHEYFIKDAATILPQYLVMYEYDPAREKKAMEIPTCDNCETEIAVVYCGADQANLCGKCDVKLHETRVASRHVRTPIGRGGDLFGHCRHHAEELIKYYCSQCHIPVCIVCKMVGNHSNGEANRHQLVSVTDAYHAVLHEAKATDPVLHARKTEISNQIAAVNARAKAVEKMGQAMQAQIDEIHRHASEDLCGIVKRKIDILLGDQLELKRQTAEYIRLEEFVKYQMLGDPTQFLFSWSRQSRLRAELHDFKFFREELDVQLDIKINGGVSVCIEQAPAALEVLSAMKTSGECHSIGLGLPSLKKPDQRRIQQRRTSDFFAETVGDFDAFSIA